jgi:hypothetical protein
MTESLPANELTDRLNLIESMIAEGRRNTESWGWVFVLWGVAYYAAIAWSAWGSHPSLAWNITVAAAMIVTFGIIAWRMDPARRKSNPPTTVSRAITSTWIAVGVSMAIFIPSLGIGGRSSSNLIVAIIGIMLGTANAASSMVLKWKLQFACAMIWWSLAVISCVGTTRQSFIGLLVANFFCQIAFGSYMMFKEARQRRQVASHA